MIRMTRPQIERYLPHRYPFLFLDTVDEVVIGETIRATKAVTGNEPVFQGHFPGNPVMPGVLQVEAMGQAGVLLCILSGAGVDAEHTMYVTAVTDCRFRRPVVPGDVMRMTATIKKRKLGTWKMDCETRVGDHLACSASVTATLGPVVPPPALPDDFPPPPFEG